MRQNPSNTTQLLQTAAVKPALVVTLAHHTLGMHCTCACVTKLLLSASPSHSARHVCSTPAVKYEKNTERVLWVVLRTRPHCGCVAARRPFPPSHSAKSAVGLRWVRRGDGRGKVDHEEVSPARLQPALTRQTTLLPLPSADGRWWLESSMSNTSWIKIGEKVKAKAKAESRARAGA